ncbi:glycerol-3-phosphatase [Hydrogenophaga crassostreae]|uniref:Glycerol-3-phosphatase n=1 Tax=Hydrogenophaga crassostreae TaxID=1763535 RepID=A0A162SPW8_9BURK|nr:HAD-IA family hydrolase [Hydrogenophaga crassostreae]AOW11505.1 glycerol-3-phosphatase [Hydrogenophaga crassostreae]OAD39344.1 glycerol-3-phosphatase [Hydrogenophaga crassostreae]
MSLFAPDRAFSAFLFDMDGTLLSSIAAAERVWTAWARRHGVDAEALLAHLHGRRAIDTIRALNLPGVDAVAEAAAITQAEINDVDGVAPIAGAPAFLAALPVGHWAVVTSAPRALAERRMAAAGLPIPAVLITAEDVGNGKPAPDGYRLAAARLGMETHNCVVFEDAPAGIQAGETAGAAVVVISATHQQPLDTAHPSVTSYEGLRPEASAGGGWRIGRA